MARAYGHIMSAIWNDPDFRSLDGDAQRVYLMLITQANISSAGTLELTIKRWSAYASDTTSDGLSESLSVLSERRFVIVDWDTEELLVRKFVKWDGGYGNEKRRPAISAAANAISSARIRAAMAIELDSLSVPHALSDSPSDTPRVVVTEVSTSHNPQHGTTTLIPDSGEGAVAIAPLALAPNCSKHPNGTEAPCGPCRSARLKFENAPKEMDPDRRRLAEAVRARIDCPDCDYDGWVLDDESKPLHKCLHGMVLPRLDPLASAR